VSKGYDLSASLKHSGLPPKFFYGTYKIIIFYTNNLKKKIGCFGFIIGVIRPWETA